MVRVVAIIGMLVAQVLAACGTGTCVICVHDDGHAHLESGHAPCCSHDDGQHEHGLGEDGLAENDCGSCTDYPLVLSQLRGAESGTRCCLSVDHSTVLTICLPTTPSLAPCLATASDRWTPATLGNGARTALSTVMLRC